MADFTKHQVLLLAVKHHEGESIAYMMEAMVDNFNKVHWGMHATGIPLDDDEEHDNYVRAAVNRMKFDIISYGGGVRAHPEWKARIDRIIGESMNKDTKKTYPENPLDAVPNILNAAREIGLKPPQGA